MKFDSQNSPNWYFDYQNCWKILIIPILKAQNHDFDEF